MFKSAPVQLPPLRPKRPARPRKEQTKTHELLKHTRVEFSLRLAAEVELLRASTERERRERKGGKGAKRAPTHLVVPLQALPVSVELLQARRANLGDPVGDSRSVSDVHCEARRPRREVQNEGSNSQVLGAAGDLATFGKAMCWITVLGLAEHEVL